MERGRTTKKDNRPGDDNKKRWRQEQFKLPEARQFESGVADFVSAWFMNHQEVSDFLHNPYKYNLIYLVQKLESTIHISHELCTTDGAEFITAIQDAEAVLNCITILVCPELYEMGMQAIDRLKEGGSVKTWHRNIKLWTSIFSGIEVIVNRITPPHRDSQAAPPVYDLLVSAGTHEEAWFDLPDIQTRLSYNPCTVVALSGKVLRHGVAGWVGGERICLAHFIRDNIHNRLNLPRPDWVKRRTYTELMDKYFAFRHGLSI